MPAKCLCYSLKVLVKSIIVHSKGTGSLMDANGNPKRYQRIDNLEWSDIEQKSGKRVKINKFPKNHKVKVFRVVSNRRTDYVTTNDLNQSDVSAVRQVCSARWKIEQFHRETKQLTGIEKCQCRLARIVRNHITCRFFSMDLPDAKSI